MTGYCSQLMEDCLFIVEEENKRHFFFFFAFRMTRYLMEGVHGVGRDLVIINGNFTAKLYIVDILLHPTVAPFLQQQPFISA